MSEWRVREGDNRIEEMIGGFAGIRTGDLSGDLDRIEEGVDLGISYNNRGEVFVNPRYQNGTTTVGIGLNLAPDLARQVARDLEAAADAAEEQR